MPRTPKRKEGLDPYAPLQDAGEKSSHWGGGQAAPGEAKPRHLVEKPIRALDQARLLSLR